jgi:hypothetical protein
MLIPLNIPSGPYFYNRAANSVKNRINLTCDHFGIHNNHRQLVGESLLRLDQMLAMDKFSAIDTRAKKLFILYDYFEALKK